MKDLRPIKACHACGASYTWTTWPRLAMLATDGPTERRRCLCGEALALDLDQARHIANAIPGEPDPAPIDDEAVTVWLTMPRACVAHLAQAIAEALNTQARSALVQAMADAQADPMTARIAVLAAAKLNPGDPK